MMTVMDYATMTTTGNTKANLANQFNKLSSLCVSICDDIQHSCSNRFLTLRNNNDIFQHFISMKINKNINLGGTSEYHLGASICRIIYFHFHSMEVFRVNRAMHDTDKALCK